MSMCLLTLFRRLLSFLEQFILIDNSYLNVILTEAERMDRKGRTKKDKTVLQIHSQLHVNTDKLRNYLNAC